METDGLPARQCCHSKAYRAGGAALTLDRLPGPASSRDREVGRRSGAAPGDEGCELRGHRRASRRCGAPRTHPQRGRGRGRLVAHLPLARPSFLLPPSLRLM